MRIRQIKPDYWSDKSLANMDAETRLFYVGLWMEADDDGFFRNDPDRIAADLFPYSGVARRERFVRAALDRLAKSGHVRLLDCGKHASVPNLPKHQIIASTRRVVRTHSEHNAQCVHNAEQVSAHLENGTGKGNGTGKREIFHTHAREGENLSTVDSLQAILSNDKSSPAAKRAARKALDQIGGQA